MLDGGSAGVAGGLRGYKGKHQLAVVCARMGQPAEAERLWPAEAERPWRPA